MSYLSYKNAEAGFEVNYPSDWTLLENYMGSTATFLSSQEGDEDTFRENVNVIVQDLSAQPLTLEEYTALSLEQLAQVISKFKPISPAGTSQLLQYPADEIIYKGKQGKFKLTWHSTWSIMNNTAYIITCTGEQKNFDKFLSIFRSIVSSFRLL